MKILIAGDFCPNDRLVDDAIAISSDTILSSIVEYTKKSDYSILNFECPIFADGAMPISKKGPTK